MKARFALALLLVTPAAAADVTPVQPVRPPSVKPIVVAKPPPCRVMLSGSMNGTLECRSAASFDTQGNRGSLGIQVGAPDHLPLILVSATVTGPLSVGTISGGTWVAGYRDSYSAFIASNQSGTVPVGSMTTAITSLKTTATTASGSVYEAHGQIDAVLQPAQGTSGALSMHVDF